jgi:FAD/FMN-containing dehydrogenase
MGLETRSRNGAPAISDESVEELRGQIRGEVLRPGDPGAAGIREAFNAMHRAAPAVVVRPTGAADVAAAVVFARDTGYEICLRGGGHSVAGLSAHEGGLLIDLSSMNGVHVDPERKRATVQGGALWGDVDRETQVFGLAAPGGVVSDTGVAGLTLGGGYGWLRRKLGLSIDHLVEAQVVCADGEIRTASEDVNPDLFWAIRGGGGNYGVVTSFTFALHEIGPEVAFSATMYALEDIDRVLRGWREFVSTAPDDVTSVVVTLTFPADPEMPPQIHDRPVALVGGVYVGDPHVGLAMMAPLRQLAEPLFDMSGPTPYTDVQSGLDALFPRNTLHCYWKSQYLDELTDEAIDVIAAAARDRPAPITLVNTFHMGGAIAAVDPEATAFAERGAPYMVSIDGMWSEAQDTEANVAWVRRQWEAIKAHGNGSVYLNFTGMADELAGDGVDTAFGRNLDRLGKVKATYDPANLFHINNNIQPMI